MEDQGSGTDSEQEVKLKHLKSQTTEEKMHPSGEPQFASSTSRSLADNRLKNL